MKIYHQLMCRPYAAARGATDSRDVELMGCPFGSWDKSSSRPLPVPRARCPTKVARLKRLAVAAPDRRTETPGRTQRRQARTPTSRQTAPGAMGGQCATK